MEFLKRKHFSLWISLLLTTWLTNVCGLQGVPTWMCLGIKSPFIEFRAEIEILANTSVSLNVTKDDQALMHEQGLQKLGTFIQPIDLRNSTTGYIKSNLTKKVTYNVVDRRKGVTEHPITEEMNRKEIELIEDESDQETDLPSINNEDRKYIIPMALKNPTAEPKKSPPQPGQDFSTNIEDLKNHILMLQNKTKNDKNFQSKFVVFPSLQRERNGGEQNRTQQVTISKVGPQRQQLASSQLPLPKPVQNTPKPSAKSRPSEGSDEDRVANVNRGKITITPQVLLLNDQTPPDDDDEEFDRRRSEDRKDGRVNYARRRNFRKTTTPSTPISSTLRPSRRPSKRQRLPGGSTGGCASCGDRRNRNKRKNCKNNDRPRCQRRRQQQLAMSESGNSNNASMSGSNRDSWGDSMDKINYSRSRTEGDSLWPSAASPSSASGSLSPSLSSLATSSILSSGERRRPNDDEQLKLSRSIRSHSRRNAGGSMKSGSGSSYDEGGRTTTRDFIIPIGNVINNNQSLAYKEKIDLNPDLCYQVGGLTYGQQKLCVLHTNIMPPISRGARSAIQECKHQLKNRRWNCSTTEDNTVFGPMTSIGSPEMAFIHALASAAATSFIARACRDGQLASCGCSRSSRPKQLNDDWTWGGCGDDLEFAYKFSQNFIDVREKERKRGTRGLVSVPPRSKFDEKLLAESEMGTTSASYDSTGGSNVSKDNNGNHNNNRSETSSSSFDVGEYSNGNRNLNNNNNNYHKNDNPPSVFKPEDLMELQEKLKEKTKEILNTKLQEKEMLELQENIKWEILNSKVFNLEHHSSLYSGKKQHQRNGGFAAGGIGGPLSSGSSQATLGRIKSGSLAKARSLMNLHNNEAGRRAVIKKTRITCKCHGVSGSCSLITCWQQLSSIREIGDYLREKYDEATQVKLNKRGRLQVKDPRYKVPTAHDLVYLDESPDWCRINRQLQWPGTHGRICNKTSSGLNGCAILCCGRGYNTKKIVVRERCNCKFHWCCQVKCEICVKVIEEHTCK